MDGLAFSPDGRTLVSSDGRMHLWRVADGTLTHTLSSELSGVADFSPDGRTLALDHARYRLAGDHHSSISMASTVYGLCRRGPTDGSRSFVGRMGRSRRHNAGGARRERDQILAYSEWRWTSVSGRQ